MIILGWVYWVAWQLISVVVAVVGWFLLLPFAALRAWSLRPSKSPMFAGRQVNAWRGGWAMFLWDNEEDGVDGAGWYKDKHVSRPAWYNAYVWSAWRNSANGMRWVPGASFLVAKKDLTIRATPWGYIATCGWRQCLKFNRFRIGWLINLDAGDGYRSWPVLGLV